VNPALLHSATMRWTIWTLLALAALIRSCPGERSRMHTQTNCLARCIKPKMIQEMMSTLQDIHRSVPNVNKEQGRHQRYVPKFLLKCTHVKRIGLNFPEQKLDVAEINRILEIYEDHVFKKLWNKETKNPKSFTHAFNTLKHSVEQCQSQIQ
ncbi:hypothetical protein NFI96_030107, partial [Prochilodus magdalenae]